MQLQQYQQKNYLRTERKFKIIKVRIKALELPMQIRKPDFISIQSRLFHYPIENGKGMGKSSENIQFFLPILS